MKLTIHSPSDPCYILYLQLLGIQSALKYIDPTYITSPCLLKLVNQTAIRSFDTSFPANKTLIAQQESTLAGVFKASQKASNNSLWIQVDATSDPGPLKVKTVPCFYVPLCPVNLDKSLAALSFLSLMHTQRGERPS